MELIWADLVKLPPIWGYARSEVVVAHEKFLVYWKWGISYRIFEYFFRVELSNRVKRVLLEDLLSFWVVGHGWIVSEALRVIACLGKNFFLLSQRWSTSWEVGYEMIERTLCPLLNTLFCFCMSWLCTHWSVNEVAIVTITLLFCHQWMARNIIRVNLMRWIHVISCSFRRTKRDGVICSSLSFSDNFGCIFRKHWLWNDFWFVCLWQFYLW